MLIKAYIKKHMFHLPMKQADLLEQVEEALNKEVNKSIIGKLHPVTKIEDNENILIEKQNTNVFLLNLLLLVLNHNEKEITKQEYYSDGLIISKLVDETQLKLTGLPFEGVEKEVSNYMYPAPQPKTETVSKNETKGFPYLKNVQFSVDWLKGANQEIDRLDQLKRAQKKSNRRE